MLEIDFEAYKYIFSVIVGGLFGIIYLTYRVMTNSTGMFTSIADKNEYGDVKILSRWNIVTLDPWSVIQSLSGSGVCVSDATGAVVLTIERLAICRSMSS